MIIRKKYKTNALINNMNVVPYIDVILVLLVIFMITTPMFLPSVVNLPKVGNSKEIDLKPVEIVILQDNQYIVNKDNKKINITGIDNLINNIKANYNPNIPIVISANENLKYSDIMKVVDKLYSSDIKKLAFVVKK